MAILTFLIGYNNLIPISLYMTTDLVRALQAFIMESDESMYHKDTSACCKVRSSGLCEDQGQVDFVLSDKTGTLTQNQMCFKACYVDGQTYGYWSETAEESHDEDASVSSECLGYPSTRIERIPCRKVCLPLSASAFAAAFGRSTCLRPTIVACALRRRAPGRQGPRRRCREFLAAELLPVPWRAYRI